MHRDSTLGQIAFSKHTLCTGYSSYWGRTSTDTRCRDHGTCDLVPHKLRPGHPLSHTDTAMTPTQCCTAPCPPWLHIPVVFVLARINNLREEMPLNWSMHTHVGTLSYTTHVLGVGIVPTPVAQDKGRAQGWSDYHEYCCCNFSFSMYANDTGTAKSNTLLLHVHL